MGGSRHFLDMRDASPQLGSLPASAWSKAFGAGRASTPNWRPGLLGAFPPASFITPGVPEPDVLCLVQTSAEPSASALTSNLKRATRMNEQFADPTALLLQKLKTLKLR